MTEDKKVNDGQSVADRIRMRKIQDGSLVRDKPKEETDDNKGKNLRDNSN